MKILVTIILAVHLTAADTDICRLPLERGHCYDFSYRWGYNEKSRGCVQFVFSGCGGNANNFKTKEACEGRCVDICSLPKEVGPCDALFRRFYFDKSVGTCKQFIFGGCGGNKNNFKSSADCVEACGVDICSLPKEVGPCKALFRRWYFDKSVGTCKKFIFGGCGGNKNNFKSSADCVKACGVDICSLPKVVGPCEAFIPRWYFDKSVGRCKRFIFGGCQGNQNNFKTPADCVEACGGEDVCSLPKETGPCRASIPRWYFDKEQQRCLQFIYGGCGGNANRFVTKVECQNSCENKAEIE